MADNGIVKHSDLFQENLAQPTIKEMLALMDVFDKTEVKIKSFATTYKSVFTGKMTTSYEDVTKLATESEKVNKVYVENATLLKEKIRLQEKLSLALTEEAQDVAALRVELEKVNLQNKQNAKITSESVGAYSQATAKLAQMTRTYKDLVIAGKESSNTAITFKKSLDELRASVVKADASVGDHRRNVGNYASGFNGLQNSINQVTREFPAFVNSAQTGFMAISNNLPMLVDQIKQLKDNNRQLIADGKPAQSVFKSLAGALFSWGSALSVGITLVTLYGKEIGNAIKSMLGFNVQTKEQIELEKKVKEVREQNIENIAKQEVEIISLSKVIEDENSTNHAKIKAYQDLQKLIPELTGLTYEQAVSEGVLTTAIEKQLKIIGLRAELEVYQESIIANKKKEVAAQRISDIEKIKLKEAELLELTKLRTLAEKNQQIIFTMGDEEDILRLQDEIAFLKQSDEQKALSVQQQIKDLETLDTIKSKANKTTEQKEKEAYEFKKRLTELGTNNIKNEYQKRLQLALIDYEENKRIAQLDIKDAEVKAETLKQLLIKYKNDVAKIENDIKEDKRKRDAEIEKEFNDFWEKENKAQMEAYDNELKLAKKQKEEKDKLAKENAKSESETIKQTLSIIEAGGQRRQNILETQNERELNLTKERQGELRQLAAMGIQDANNNLAFEEKREAELISKRQKLEERKRRQELATAAIKSYSANVEKAGGDGTALTKTLKDISVLMGAVRAIPAFFEGTEDTGTGGNVDNKGGFKAILHPRERVMTKEQNELLGDLTNNELANIGKMWNNGLLSPTYFDKVPMSYHVNDNLLVNEMKSVKGEIKELQKIIDNKPVTKLDYDPIKNAVLNIEVTGRKTTITETKNKGGLFRG